MKIAIYSRKSVYTAKGESIENQISLCKEHCEVYFKNQNPEYIIYEDEGFSGKNVHRPKFQQLLEDIKSQHINVLICYRLDRISRSVADFSSILELLQKYNVDFISINERFDTSTPNGRAMIYISSVFAQLERETIAERVRDNMLQLAKMGKWSGGQLPLGYASEKVNYLNEEMKEKSFIRLVPVEKELEIVKLIYSNYLVKNSIRKITKELNTSKLKSKNGGNFDLTQVKRILRNPLYVKSSESTHKYLSSINFNVFGIPNGNGYLTYNKKTDKDNLIAAVASHSGIISSYQWLEVQNKLDKNREKNASRTGTGSNNTLFSGLLKCSKCGANMVVKYNTKNKNGDNYIYYVCSNKNSRYVTSKCDCPNLRADLIDKKIIDKIKTYNKEVILSAYNEKLKELTSFSDKNLISNLNSKLSKAEAQARNLGAKIAETFDEFTSKILIEQLSNLGKEITQLKEQIKSEDKSKENIKNEINIIKTLKDSFTNFNDSFDSTDDINIKRNLINNIVSSIVYNIDSNNFEVTFFGLDNMHFDDTSESLDSYLYSSKRGSYCGFT